MAELERERLSPDELRYALSVSKTSGRKLGRVLAEEGLVDRSAIRQTLVEQFALRFMTTAVTVFISLAGMGAAKQARASSIKDVPSRIALTALERVLAQLDHGAAIAGRHFGNGGFHGFLQGTGRIGSRNGSVRFKKNQNLPPPILPGSACLTTASIAFSYSPSSAR